jgi:hypothetical protein
MFYGNTQDYYRHTAFYRLKSHMDGHSHFRKTDILMLLLPYLSPHQVLARYISFSNNKAGALLEKEGDFGRFPALIGA